MLLLQNIREYLKKNTLKAGLLKLMNSAAPLWEFTALKDPKKKFPLYISSFQNFDKLQNNILIGELMWRELFCYSLSGSPSLSKSLTREPRLLI